MYYWSKDICSSPEYIHVLFDGANIFVDSKSCSYLLCYLISYYHRNYCFPLNIRKCFSIEILLFWFLLFTQTKTKSYNIIGFGCLRGIEHFIFISTMAPLNILFLMLKNVFFLSLSYSLINIEHLLGLVMNFLKTRRPRNEYF